MIVLAGKFWKFGAFVSVGSTSLPPVTLKIGDFPQTPSIIWEIAFDPRIPGQYNRAVLVVPPQRWFWLQTERSGGNPAALQASFWVESMQDMGTGIARLDDSDDPEGS